jgi:aminoglycoside 3-N-acetyltransferase
VPTEADAIAQCTKPRTREGIARDLLDLGLQEGMTVLVHSSLSSLGWVCGGPVTVIQALMDVVTDKGTIVMPAMSPGNSDPMLWHNPPVPGEWKEIIRATMPAFDPLVTPARGMGITAEVFRTWPGTVRSAHPSTSFAARGCHADDVVRDHKLDNCLGETSPLARLYDLDAAVLLLGVGYDCNTCFHLSEYRAPGARSVTEGSAVMIAGQRTWTTYTDIELHEERFMQIGTAFEQTGAVRVGYVGSAQSRLFKERAAVDFAVRQIVRAREETEAS